MNTILVAVDAPLVEIALVVGHDLAVVGPLDAGRRVVATKIRIAMTEETEAGVGVAQDAAGGFGLPEEQVAGRTAHLAVRALGETGRHFRVAIVALEDGRVTLRTGQRLVGSTHMTVSTPVNERVQSGLAKIAIHEERLVRIMAIEAQRLRIRNPDSLAGPQPKQALSGA